MKASKEVSPVSTLEKIDEIIFRCFDQGTYWGKLAYSDNERPDQPDNPIDRGEANKLILKEISNLISSAQPEKNDGHDFYKLPEHLKPYYNGFNECRELYHTNLLKGLKDE